MSAEQIGLVIGLIMIAMSIGYVLGWAKGQADMAHEQLEFMKAQQPPEGVEHASSDKENSDE